VTRTLKVITNKRTNITTANSLQLITMIMYDIRLVAKKLKRGWAMSREMSLPITSQTLKILLINEFLKTILCFI
jgi:hypothetical protein